MSPTHAAPQSPGPDFAQSDWLNVTHRLRQRLGSLHHQTAGTHLAQEASLANPTIHRTMNTRIITLFSLVIVSGLLASCRTTQGLGQDLQHLGNKIEEEAGEHTRH
jgi:predicted small secreted protein